MTPEQKLRRLRSALRTEQFLAERNYGVELHPRKHADLIAGHKLLATALSKLLKESYK